MLFSCRTFLIAVFITLSVTIPVSGAATLFTGGTVVAWNTSTEEIEVFRSGSVLVENETISAVFSGLPNITLPSDLEVLNITGDIITTGFIDTHRHSWQTAFKTIGSNTTLLQYLAYYGSASAAGEVFTPEDVYVGQLIGLYEALHGGVTTIVDFAHCTWSSAHAKAALNSAFESGARMVWAYNFGNYSRTNFTFANQVELFRDIANENRFDQSAVELGISYDGFGESSEQQSRTVLDLAR